MSSYQDLYYTVADGLTLYARDYPGPSDDAPVVLCLPGLTRNSRDFEDIAPILATTHRVLVAEQRGRGDSDYDSQLDRYTPATYIGDMLQLLAQQGITQCAIVGTSMGGLMAMGMSAASPGLLTRVVINDIGPILAEAGLNRIKSVVGTTSEFPDWAAAADYSREVNGQAFPHYTDADWDRASQRICVERDGKVILNYDQNIAAPMKNDQKGADPNALWAMFETLKDTPLMLIRGEISDLLDPAGVAEMQRRHPGMVFLEVPGVGHAPMLDEPGVAEAITAFLNP